MDDCVSSPCVNGNCTDLKKDYNCTCFAGYSSKNCDIGMKGSEQIYFVYVLLHGLRQSISMCSMTKKLKQII